jgi:hypothetical protein
MAAPEQGFRPEADTQEQQTPEQRARESLSLDVFEPRQGDARDAFPRVPDVQDRAAFRRQCAQELDTFGKNLTAAGQKMGQFNKDAAEGKIKIGTPAETEQFNKQLDEAKNAYKAVIEQAAKTRFDTTGGQPRESDLIVNARRELAMLGGELNFSKIKNSPRKRCSSSVSQAMIRRRHSKRALKKR